MHKDTRYYCDKINVTPQRNRKLHVMVNCQVNVLMFKVIPIFSFLQLTQCIMYSKSAIKTRTNFIGG